MTQNFKSIYFKDSKSDTEKIVTLAFNEAEFPLYEKINPLSTHEIKELLKTDSFDSIQQNALKDKRSLNQYIKLKLESKIDKVKCINPKEATFQNSKHVPFQRWYPYIEGYSINFVDYLIGKYASNAKAIYDPFAGTGTTLFASENNGAKPYYSEVNPLLTYLINTKISLINLDLKARKDIVQKLRNFSANIYSITNVHPDVQLDVKFKKVFGKSQYFEGDNYQLILKAKTYLRKLSNEDELLSDTIALAVLTVLIPTSLLKKSGDLRFKTKKELKNDNRDFLNHLRQKLIEMTHDIESVKNQINIQAELVAENAKNVYKLNEISFDAVITSPPYLNGTNYFRNTKLELWFLEYLNTANDLREFRNKVLTSGINDVKLVKQDNNTNNIDIFSKSHELRNVYKTLVDKAYDKRIPEMVKDYFIEMHQIFFGISKHLEYRSNILIDIGDSNFAGVHVKTDVILLEVLESLGYESITVEILRQRRSRNGAILKQVLLHLQNTTKEKNSIHNSFQKVAWKHDWKIFKDDLPYQQKPYSKRNWGNGNHSLCSYQGKLKPSIAHFLVDTFVPTDGSFFDPFSGVGTIPFEGALNGKKSYSMDISQPAYLISTAKVKRQDSNKIKAEVDKLENYIRNELLNEAEINQYNNFGFNKKIIEYYNPNTYKEILLARKYFVSQKVLSNEQALIVSCLMHILHGNRPYALSRRSHPIVPYAPTGEYEYKSLIEKLKEKVNKSINTFDYSNFVEGEVYRKDSTKLWPLKIDNLDAIITSPPFFDSTRFYLANWIRLWFSGWEPEQFNTDPKSFIEEKQKIDFAIYKPIFQQARERLKNGGVMVMHLGKSSKCDMADELVKISKLWFRKADLFDESVVHCESHGIRDKGTVTSHQYLVLT